MIKALIINEGKTRLLMGLTPRNFELMQQGEPVLIGGADLAHQSVDEMLFFFAENTAAAEEYLRKLGITRDKADAVIDNRCHKPGCKDCS